MLPNGSCEDAEARNVYVSVASATSVNSGFTFGLFFSVTLWWLQSLAARMSARASPSRPSLILLA